MLKLGFIVDSAEAARNALECVLEARENERLVIFCDDVRADVGEAFHEGARTLGLETHLIVSETSEQVFRKELPAQHAILNLLIGGVFQV